MDALSLKVNMYIRIWINRNFYSGNLKGRNNLGDLGEDSIKLDLQGRLCFQHTYNGNRNRHTGYLDEHLP
jgi:hypothetical protein